MSSVQNCSFREREQVGLVGVWNELRRMNGVELALRLTLIIMLVYPGHGTGVAISIRTMGMIGAVSDVARRSPIFWFVSFLLHFTLQNIGNWYQSDNHNFLISYWYLALACSFLSSNPASAVALNGRLLIGLTFLLATISKIFTPEYMSEDTFRYLLFSDPRFSEVATVFGGLERIPREGSPQQQMRELRPKVVFPSVPRINVLARFLTWWTLIVEASIALFFLVPKLRPVRQAHHHFVISFRHIRLSNRSCARLRHGITGNGRCAMR